jgi:hypothetical protein
MFTKSEFFVLRDFRWTLLLDQSKEGNDPQSRSATAAAEAAIQWRSERRSGKLARMVSVVENIAIDCADAYALAKWWSGVTGRPLHPEDFPGDPEAQVLLSDNGPVLHFNQVPEAKTAKNRIHLCLRPETSRDQEVDRLLALGAGFVADHRKPDGSGWAVLADPEGNEFCVLRSASDRAAMQA